MKVKELIEELKKHNPELEVNCLGHYSSPEIDRFKEAEEFDYTIPINIVQRNVEFGTPIVLLIEKKQSVVD